MRAYRCRGCGLRVVKASPLRSAFERCNECWDGVLVAVVTCGRCHGVIGLRGSRQDAGLYTDPDTLLAEPCPTCLMPPNDPRFDIIAYGARPFPSAAPPVRTIAENVSQADASLIAAAPEG